MAIADNAVYDDGRRTAGPDSLEVNYELPDDRNCMRSIELYRPEHDEIESVARSSPCTSPSRTP